MSDLFEDVGEDDDFEYCPHGIGFDEDCEDCELEDEEEDDPTEVDGVDYLNNWA